jgi:hypothetical protein
MQLRIKRRKIMTARFGEEKTVRKDARFEKGNFGTLT